MPNVLIISDEAEELYTLFRSVKVTLKKQDSEQKGNARETTSVSLGKYDIAFLDLNTRGWQQRILEMRQRMPVIAFSSPDLKMAVEAMKLGACDFLEKPLTSDVLSDVISKHKKKILGHAYGFDELIGRSKVMQEFINQDKMTQTKIKNFVKFIDNEKWQ